MYLIMGETKEEINGTRRTKTRIRTKNERSYKIKKVSYKSG